MRIRIVSLALIAACGLALAAEPAKLESAKPQAASSDVHDFIFLAESRPVLVRLHVRIDGKPLEAAWTDFMKYVFNYLDVDGDGVLSKAEAERSPTLEQIVTGGLARAFGGLGGSSNAPTMEGLDTDKDGKVTFAEFTAWYRKNGLTPLHLQVAAGQPNQLAQLAYLTGAKPEPSIDAVSAAIFTLLDKNKDGKLSREELAAAAAVLLPLDEDDDEIITTRELVPNASAPPGPALGGMMAMGNNAKSESGSKNSIVVLIASPGEMPADLVRRIQERYGPKSDKPAEKKFSRKDLGLDDKTFNALDANHDGVLDAQELAGFAKRVPDFEYTLQLGGEASNNSALIDLGTTRAELRSIVEERSDGITGIIRQQYLAQFKQADKDDNGYLDQKEAEASQLFKGLFKAMDRDGDGKLTEKEVNDYLDKYREIQDRANGGCVTLVVTDQSRGLFDLLDTNRDGRLSIREMRDAPKLLDRFDRGHKGYLTKEDVPRTYELSLRRGPSDTSGASGALAQINKIYSPSYRTEAAGPTAGPLWFRKMDRNRDGDVSRKEFIGTDEEFRRLDTNGDGLISLEEAIAAEKARKKKVIDD